VKDKATYQFTVDASIREDKGRVFTALTDPRELSVWFTRDAVVDLRPGGRYSNADGDTGTFLEITPPHRLSFTWENPDHCPATRVAITLSGHSESEKAVIISITHSELGSHEDVNTMKVGWKWALISLRSYLETGVPVRFEDWQRSMRDGDKRSEQESRDEDNMEREKGRERGKD
jgi:uncharacterized protein YndB with AHSA1/START domain